MRDFRKIEAWQLADDLTVSIYCETRGFPVEELYGLTSQLRRAAYSVPANIAEGAARQTRRDYLHFLYIARGSLAETRYFIHLAERLGYISHVAASGLEDAAGHVFACLHGLIRAVERDVGTLSRSATAPASMSSEVLSP